MDNCGTDEVTFHDPAIMIPVCSVTVGAAYLPDRFRVCKHVIILHKGCLHLRIPEKWNAILVRWARYEAKARLLIVYGNLERYCVNFSIAVSPESVDLM